MRLKYRKYRKWLVSILFSSALFGCLVSTISAQPPVDYVVAFERFALNQRSTGTDSLELTWKCLAVTLPNDSEGLPILKEVDANIQLSFRINVSKVGVQETLFSAETLETSMVRVPLPAYKEGDTFIARVNLVSTDQSRDVTDTVNCRINPATNTNYGVAYLEIKQDSYFPAITKEIRRLGSAIYHVLQQGGIVSFFLLVVFILGIIAILVFYRVIMCTPSLHPKYLQRWKEELNRANIDDIMNGLQSQEKGVIKTNSGWKIGFRQKHKGHDLVSEVLSQTLQDCQSVLQEDVQLSEIRKIQKQLRLKARHEIDEILNLKIRRPFSGGKKRSISNFFLSLDSIWNMSVISPMIGLFGTVYGISDSFSDLSMKTGFKKPDELIAEMASGINLALCTTLAGLFVGILFILAHYLLNARIMRIEADLFTLADIVIRRMEIWIVQQNRRVVT